MQTVLSDPDSGGPLTSPTYAWEFDLASQLVAAVDPLGRRTDYVLDGLGRLIETRGVDPDGAGAATRPVWQTEFDLAGNVLVERDPLGHERTHSYDQLYRRTQTVLEDPDAGGPLQSPTIAYTWDAVGNMLSLVDPASNTTSWQYDDQNRPTHETNELGLTRVTAFDNVGNATSYTDRNGGVTEWDRDSLYRVTAERWEDSLGNTVHTITSEWDAASQLTEISDAFATYAYTRDNLGRVTSIDNLGTPGVPNVVLAQAWDAASRRTELSATIAGTADFDNAYSFDALGRMTRIEQTDGAPVAGYAITAKRVDLAYLADGRFNTITRYEDLAGTDLVAQTTFGYDQAGRLISLDHTKSTTTLAAHDWTLDAAGRITSYTSLADGTSTYGYDNNWQILSADHQSQSDESFSWDANGNPTMTGWVVDSNNRLTSDGTYSYQYDDEGNATRRTTIATGEYVEYSWDHRNRMTDVRYKTSGGVTTKHVKLSYDAWDRLIRKRVDDDGNGSFDRGESYVYDDAPGKQGLSDVVLVFSDDGTGGSSSLAHRFLHGPAVDQVFADEDALGEILWGLTDHQGTTRDVADYDAATDTTSVANHVEYSAFGQITGQSNSAAEPFHSYTGRVWDDDVGALYLRRRWFGLAGIRFFNEDPSGFAGGDTNLGRYTLNSPTNFTDPSGLRISPQQYMNAIAQAQAAQARTAQAYAAAQAEYYRLEALLSHESYAQYATEIRARQRTLAWWARRLRVEYANRALSISQDHRALRLAIEAENRRRARTERPALPPHTGSSKPAGEWEMDLAEAHRRRMGQYVRQALDTLEGAGGAGLEAGRDQLLGAGLGYLGTRAGMWLYDKISDMRDVRRWQRAYDEAAEAAEQSRMHRPRAAQPPSTRTPPPTGARPRTLQTGGHTITDRTRRALDLSREQAKEAMEKLKDALGQQPRHHGHKILDNGDVIDSHTGEWLGNLLN